MTDAGRLKEALQLFLATMDKYGNWDEGCFYYSKTAAPELERPIQLARKAMAAISKGGGRA